MVEFHNTSSILSSLIVCVYNLGLAVGPLILAPMSEMYGRLMPYHVTNVLFTLFTLGCALSPNLPALIIFRMLAGMEASAVLNIGGATVADMFIQEERGFAMAVWTFGPLLGPAVGPVAGGYLAQGKGWRWVFWVVAIGVSLFCLHLWRRGSESYVFPSRQVSSPSYSSLLSARHMRRFSSNARSTVFVKRRATQISSLHWRAT
jgi:multidrug resistance protein